MARGLDYAFSHPNMPCVAQSGYSFVARYVGDPDPNPLKYLDAAEVKVCKTLGLSIVACRETSAGFMFNESGASHARASRAHTNDLGLYGIPIYYALDVDPRNLTNAQINAVTKFLQDAAAVDGGGMFVGLYGAAAAIDRWVGTPYCHWGWQTYAWSGGRISPKAHFRQYKNGQSVCGGTVDLNETYARDFGQWPRPGVTPTPPASGGFDLSDEQYNAIMTELRRPPQLVIRPDGPVDYLGTPGLVDDDGYPVCVWNGTSKTWIRSESALNLLILTNMVQVPRDANGNVADRYGVAISVDEFNKIPWTVGWDDVARITREQVDAALADFNPDLDIDEGAVVAAITQAVTAAVNQAFSSLSATLTGTAHSEVSGQITFPPAPTE